MKKVSKNKIEGRAHMSDKEKFLVDTFQFFSKIINKVVALNYCLTFLNSYPKTKLWEKTFGREDYIRYHIESYYGNITGVFDRCLLLVNFIYDLGFQERDVKYELIKSNKHIKDKSVKKILDLFNKSIAGIKSLSNVIKHRGKFSDKELDEIGMYEFFIRNRDKVKLTKKEESVFDSLIKYGYHSYITEKKKEFKKNNEAMIKICDGFFLSIFKKYQERLNHLQE